MTEPLRIVVVDDDEMQLAFVTQVLEHEGYVVRAFSEASRALEHCAREAPALLISDVLMPEMGGFELQTRYLARFPDRTTPFVFLSSLSDSGTVTRGLDAGADDFLQKPVDAQILRAKVRALLRRRRRIAETSFRGDLKGMPLPALLRFCEEQGLTGYVDVFIGDRLVSLQFRAGQMDDAGADEALTALAALTAAPFVIHSSPLDFSALRGRRGSVPPPPPDRPLGRLSSVRLNRKVFLVQTELTGDDPMFIVSVVTIDGRTIWKHSERVPPGASPGAIAATIDTMHDRIEQKLDAKMAESLAPTTAAEPAPTVGFADLFDEGFDRFRAKDYAGAVNVWERALALDANNAALLVNLRIAREKSKGERTG